MLNDIYQFIVDIEPLLLVIIPAIFALYVKIKNKIKQKQKEINDEIIAKNKDEFIIWEHNQSIEIISKIKSMCNYYKDIGHMDLVNYIQLENGTFASSKLSNMFLSCLAEDDRYSMVPKMVDKIQRIPYGRMSMWANAIINSSDGICRIDNYKQISEDFSKLINDKTINSFISCAVKDSKGIIIGICSFFFNKENCCGTDEVSQNLCNNTIRKFATSVETIFLEYDIARKNKKKELNLNTI